jgi:hypothetical protein
VKSAVKEIATNSKIFVFAFSDFKRWLPMKMKEKSKIIKRRKYNFIIPHYIKGLIWLIFEIGL